jgi:hypothetical protein
MNGVQVSKFRPGPKYLVNHIIGLDCLTISDAPSDEAFPDCAALSFTCDIYKENDSDDGKKLLQVILAFDSPEEKEVFIRTLNKAWIDIDLERRK